MEDTSKWPGTIRTIDGQKKYDLARKVGNVKELLDEQIVKEFKYWVIVKNRFPYDLCFETHDLLVPRRKAVSRQDLNENEVKELYDLIYEHLDQNYDVILENLRHQRSITDHFHLHLCRYYRYRGEFKLD